MMDVLVVKQVIPKGWMMVSGDTGLTSGLPRDGAHVVALCACWRGNHRRHVGVLSSWPRWPDCQLTLRNTLQALPPRWWCHCHRPPHVAHEVRLVGEPSSWLSWELPRLGCVKGCTFGGALWVRMEVAMRTSRLP